MKRYSEYKDSGVKWLGEIPSHWEIVKIKNICFPLKSGGTPQSGHDEFYSDEGTPWVAIGDMSNVDYLYKTTKCVTKKGINNKKLTVYPKGTLLYSIYATLGKVCTLCVPATINQAILAINVRNESYYQPYLKYYLKCIEPNLPSYSNSNTQSNLNAEIVNNLRVLSCPISEQKHIVSYLDSATSKIDEAIAQQQKMIDLLNERKQIIINNAVTKGLNPNVKMKPSGIDWIGDIPEHWEVVKTSYIFNHIGSGTTPKSGQEDYYSEDGHYFLQTGDLNNGYIEDTSKKITDKALRGTKLKIYPKGSLVIAMYGATIGKLGILNINTTVNQACCVLPESKSMITRYAFYSLMVAKNDLILQSRGGGQPNISQDTIKNEKLMVPPLDEQYNIIDYIDKKCIPIQTSIDTANKQISLLQERKQIIINDVVTGKVKVV